MGASLTRPAWHGACGQHDHSCSGDFTRSIVAYSVNAVACSISILQYSATLMLPLSLRISCDFSERLHEDVKHAILLQDEVSPGLGCMAVQVPASCTLPAAPPWPEEATHPLAPLPTVRQANGVETTRGAFYEVPPGQLPLSG